MKRLMPLTIAVALSLPQLARAIEDPFADGIDALAVAETDGSMSLRARKKITKPSADMVMVRVKAVDKANFPKCIVAAQVLKTAKCEEKPHKLIGRGKVYRFVPELKLTDGKVDLTDETTQKNLGACYYPPKTTLYVRIKDVDFDSKAFVASTIIPK